MDIRRQSQKNLLVATKGHPFDRQAFFAMFDAMPGLVWTHVEQPAAARLMSPPLAQDFAALVFYDVPGIRFRTLGPPEIVAPPADLQAGFEALLDIGKPMIFLHHAMAGWPAWDLYAQTVGARFFYQPGAYKGRAYPDSGYLAPVRYTAAPLAPHPVTAGLEAGFEIVDELYLFEMLETDVVPLMRAQFQFEDKNFYSAAQALEGRMRSRAGWSHPPGADVIAWAKRSGNSPVVVLQCGDGGAAFAHAGYRRLLRNAVDWVTGEAAAAWARGREP